MKSRRSPSAGGRTSRRRARRPRAGLAALVLLLSAACEVEWAGARISLEDPTPAPPPGTPEEAPEEPALPLPEGPLLYLARPVPGAGVRVTPFARLPAAPDSLAGLGFPAEAGPDYRARFDSVFLRPGLELGLHALGERVGGIVIRGTAVAADPACPSVAEATPLLVPGQPLPEVAFAVPLEAGAGIPTRVSPPQTSREMVLTAPVLAERLIDDPRAFLAQRVALGAVRLPGDTVPGMTATYLVADALAPGPPTGEAISLFFVARREPASGFIPVWSEVRRYETADEKQALAYVDWIRLPSRRVDFVRLVEGGGTRLAASVRPAEGEENGWGVDWSEEPGCPALSRVRASPPAAGTGEAAGGNPAQ